MNFRFPISKCRLFLCVLCASALIGLPFQAGAQQKITAAVVITNSTVNGLTFTVNGSPRTWTNNVFNTATMVLTNADVTGCGSKSNLLDQIRGNPFPQVNSADTGSNSFTLVGNANLAMSVTASGAYASISYATQTVSQVIALQGPVSALPIAAARTNVASAIVGAANAVENTNSINQNSLAAAQLMGLSNSQLVSGAKLLTNAAGSFCGALSNSPFISGTVIALIAGLYTSPILASPTSTNLVNYGNAISSPGSGINSEQFGASASASATVATAFGNNSVAQAFAATAIGAQAAANGTNTTSVGYQTESDGTGSSVFGYQAIASADRATALGYRSAAEFTNSTAVGANSQTTAPNQVMLGAPEVGAVVQNNLTVQTNLVVGGTATIGGATIIAGNLVIAGNFTATGVGTNATYSGTNNFLANSDIAFTRKAVSSLANGSPNQAVPIGTNVFIQVSGPTAAFTINGIANGRDGKLIILQNSTGQTMTLANDSGGDSTPANRILTGLSGDYANTNNPGCVTLIYNGSSSRWILVSHN